MILNSGLEKFTSVRRKACSTSTKSFRLLVLSNTLLLFTVE
jgi:hypothetical protein